ncbi:CotH kinase family protein [Butyrivibrio sp. LC3010]|uniref:CotH kinase family protein n=1 Tax=Butyrivibrio sp. LC3010 TaxID=1280680 RepID=UPI000479681A|nr:CotH kinase family protein [Butyrivibrio sp. LC3010]
MRNRYFYRLTGSILLMLLVFLLIYCIKSEYRDINAYPENVTGITLCINEVMYENLGQQLDSDGDNSDWIEIYNYGTEAVDLYGISIADHVVDDKRWHFPVYELGAGNYLIVWASGKDKVTDDGEMHTDFLINPSDRLILYDENNNIIDEMEIKSAVQPGISVGRPVKEPQVLAILSNNSPGFPNNAKPVSYVPRVDTKLEAPSFSVPSGIYEEFALELSTNDKESVIVYTLDGSEPDENSHVYTGPLTIRDRSDEENIFGNTKTTLDYLFKKKWENSYNYKGAVVRARALKDGVLSKDISTESFFIAPKTSMNIVSLTVNPEEMFDEWDGLYVPGKTYYLWKKYNKSIENSFSTPANYYSDKKVNAHVQIFNKDGALKADNDVKLKVAGSASKSNAAKGLRLIVNDETAGFDVGIFELLPADNFEDEISGDVNAITLRPSGSDFNKTMFCDVLCQALIAGNLDVPYLAAEPAVLFINGEYWGIHNIREVCNEEYFYRHYGIDSENLNLINLNIGTAPYVTEIIAGTDDDLEEYYDLIEYVKTHDMNEQANYAYFCDSVDVDNLIDYLVAEVYFANYDWPGNNYRIWRADQPDSAYGDNKWRFFLYDLDKALTFSDFNSLEFLFEENYDKSILEGMSHYHDENRELFYSLIKNKAFSDKYYNRLKECLDTCFSEATVIDKIDTIYEIYAPEIESQFLRWHTTDGWLKKIKNMIKPGYSEDDIYTVENWENNVEAMKKFAESRPGVLREYIKNIKCGNSN